MTVSKGELARKTVLTAARTPPVPSTAPVAAGALAAIESAAEARLAYLAQAAAPSLAQVLSDGLAVRNSWRPGELGTLLRAPTHAQLGAAYTALEPLGEVDGNPAVVRWFWNGAVENPSGPVGPFDGCWTTGHTFLGIGNETENPCDGG